ncbi:unnamed protein product [Ectocarpus sp. CCAP 1310/34]|nr:unnamed protein product [Ectocarpus sp. CCAP 1310/34]
MIEGLAAAVLPGTEVPVERLRVPREPPERRPFDLDAAVFLADFAFEVYRDPGKVAWEVPGPSSVRFKEGAFVSKVFPGLLTVSLLAAEGLPIVLEPVGGDAGKREREINPSVSMVLADEDMRSGTLTSVKRPLPGGRCWGELFSMHVHDPETSVLEVGLWDKGEEGAIPLSMTGVFRGDGGKELVGTARVPLCKVLKGMSKGRDDAWTGWVEIDPIPLPEDEDEDDDKKTHPDADGVGGGGRPMAAARLHVDLRFAPMERYQGGDLPTAPRASDKDVGGVGNFAGSMRARWQNLVGQDDTAAAGGNEDTAAAAAAADGEGVEVYAPGLSANRTFLYKEGEEGGSVMAGRMDAANSGGGGDNLSSTRPSKGSSASGGGGRGSSPAEGEGGRFWKWRGEAGGDKAKRGGGGGGNEGKAKVKRKRKPVVLREDGMPDWSVLTNRVDGLAEQARSFEFMCFIDNHDTDTQASGGLARRGQEAYGRLLPRHGAARGRDYGRQLSAVTEDLDHSGVIRRAVLPAVDDVMAAVRETTAGWKKERVQPIPVTLAQQKVHMLESMNKLLDTSRALLKDLKDTTTASAAAGGVKQLSGDKSGGTVPDGAATAAAATSKGGGGVESGGSAVGARPADEILSAVTGLLRLGGPAEPASADEGGVLTTTSRAADTAAAAAATSGGGGDEQERKVGGTAAAAAATAATNLIKLLDSSNDAAGGGGAAAAAAAAAANTTANSDGEGDGVGRRVVSKLWKRWKGEGQAGGAGGEMSKAPKAPGLSGERGLADTLAWVQQVAEQKMDEMASSQTFIGEEMRRQMQLLSEGKVNATESREILAGFFREQLEKVEATKELVDRVEEFRESLGKVGVEWDGDAGGLVGLDGLQERVQEQGRKAIDDKIVSFQAMLSNVTALQQQQQQLEQQSWRGSENGGNVTTPVADGDGNDGGEEAAAAKDPPRIHAGFRRAYVSVNGTLSAVLGSAMEGKPEDWHVYITGHSLGGALATLATLDHCRRYPEAKVTMYNFGSPRVGNKAFAELYDSFVGDSFRVVNNLDIVARMPRATMGGISLDYQHCGRTVMVAEDPEEPPWIQGESGGECPLEETDPVMLLTQGKTDFFSAEIDFMKALLSGKGIDHHMEYNYFAALDSFYDPDDVKEA